MNALPFSFFERPALHVARDLIGCTLVRVINGKEIRAVITETEAYIGPHDLASHASRGRTARTAVMFGKAGTIYVYLIYGIHSMLNIVTSRLDYPAAVLIRAVHDIDGPGKVAKALHIDRTLNTKMLGTETGLWIEPRVMDKKISILRTPRIGVAYAGPIWSEKKYRFVLKA